MEELHGPGYESATRRLMGIGKGIQSRPTVTELSELLAIDDHPAAERLHNAEVIFDFVNLEQGDAIALQLAKDNTLFVTRGSDGFLYVDYYSAEKNKIMFENIQIVNAGACFKTEEWGMVFEDGPPRAKKGCYFRGYVAIARGDQRGYKYLPKTFGPVESCSEIVSLGDPAVWASSAAPDF